MSDARERLTLKEIPSSRDNLGVGKLAERWSGMRQAITGDELPLGLDDLWAGLAAEEDTLRRRQIVDRMRAVVEARDRGFALVSALLIPRTPIVERYLDLHEQGGEKQRRARAEETTAHQLEADFASSVELFRSYANPIDAFHSRSAAAVPATGDALKDKIAACFGTQKDLDVPGLGVLSYVDREIRAARTAQWPSHGMQRVEAVVNDFLLHRNRVPVVAELKTDTDTDAFYALVQLLACGSQLATLNQATRLRDKYKDDRLADASQGIELVHLFVARSKRSDDRRAIDARAEELAKELMGRIGITASIKRISQVELELSGDALQGSCSWSYAD